jgi:hypothetical protein
MRILDRVYNVMNETMAEWAQSLDKENVTAEVHTTKNDKINNGDFAVYHAFLTTLHHTVGTLNDGYVCNVLLLRAPWIQSANHVTCHGDVMRDGSIPLHFTPRVNSTPHHATRV